MLTQPLTTAPPLSRRRTPRAAGGVVCSRGGRRCFFAVLAPPSFSGTASKEHEVKAAFVFNFTKFVEWPPDRFSSGAAPIVIAVLGRDPFGAELENLVRDRLVGGRRIAVQRFSSAQAAKAAGARFHVLFVAAGEEALFASLETILSRSGVLTVGESDRFAALGGMMNFVVVEERVRFEINRAAVGAAGLRLRAQLQKLAVPGRRPEGSPPP